jgi:predicted DCC family thiol-disulfide oxidoreductase YuxK
VTVATVLYDGDCGFCTACVTAVAQRLRVPVALEPWQRADVDALGVPRTDAERRLQWVTPAGDRREGHEAVAAWLRAGGRAHLAAILTAPVAGRAAALAYRAVAANRSRIPGPWPRTCRRPPSGGHFEG